jgi:HEAT repeat protein
MNGYGRSSNEFTPQPPEAMAPIEVEWVAGVEFSDGIVRPSPLREADIASSIEDLASDDFGHRTRGSRALLAYGEEAIPYLGYRFSLAQAEPDPHCPACIVMNTILAKLPASRIGVQLESPYALARIAAAEAAGEKQLQELAPELVTLLDDEDPAVRRAAVTALRRITQTFLGYRAEASPAKRAKAIEAWKREVGSAKQ